MTRINPFQSLSGDPAVLAKLAEVADVVDQVRDYLPFLPMLQKMVTPSSAPPINMFPAVLTEFKATDGGNDQWEYAWFEFGSDVIHATAGPHPPFKEGRRDSSSGTDNPVNPFKLAAKNTLEFGNPIGQSGINGVGVKTGEITASDGVTVIANSTFLPIGYGDKENLAGPTETQLRVVVIMMELPYEIFGTRYWFSASNAVLVECAD